MSALKHIDALPANFDAFVEEVGAAIETLYGEASAQAYRNQVRQHTAAAIRLPQVDAIALMHGDQAEALLLAQTRGTDAEISFIHVLAPCAGRGCEKRVIDESVRTLRAGGVDSILCECAVHGLTEITPAFEALQFTIVERALMFADTETLADPASRETRALKQKDIPKAADLLVSAYEGHADLGLHADVRDASAASAFLHRVRAGAYGNASPAFSRVAADNDECAGIVVGAEVSGGIGFCLQLAVHPARRGHGLGEILLREQAAAFATARLPRTALGVTLKNPARRLYERLGFVEQKRINAHAWRRFQPGDDA